MHIFELKIINPTLIYKNQQYNCKKKSHYCIAFFRVIWYAIPDLRSTPQKSKFISARGMTARILGRRNRGVEN